MVLYLVNEYNLFWLLQNVCLCYSLPGITYYRRMANVPEVCNIIRCFSLHFSGILPVKLYSCLQAYNCFGNTESFIVQLKRVWREYDMVAVGLRKTWVGKHTAVVRRVFNERSNRHFFGFHHQTGRLLMKDVGRRYIGLNWLHCSNISL